MEQLGSPSPLTQVDNAPARSPSPVSPSPSLRTASSRPQFSSVSRSIPPPKARAPRL
jgi:hypothetical protein